MPGMSEVRARLIELRNQCGEPSLDNLSVAAELLPHRTLPKTTISDLLNGRTSPRWETVETFVLACAKFARQRRITVSPDRVDIARWRTMFDDARRPAVMLAGGPLREPYRAPDTAETPVRLLRAEYAVVPFQARDELTVLLDLCRQISAGHRTGLAVIQGVGGAGKTRLALELADRLRGEGWYAGILPKDTPADPLATVPGPVLVVLDYADGRVPDAIALLRKLRDRSGPPAVVVLTARSTEGQWLTDIIGALDDDRHAYRREEIRLPDHHPDAGDVFLSTAIALHPDNRLPAELPAPAQGIRWTTLDLVLLGWIAASGSAALPTTRADLYDEVLRHEENYWSAVYTSLGTGTHPDRALLRKASACLSLVTPTEEHADTVLTAISYLREDPRERRAIQRTLRICLNPTPGEGLAVRPDPIGDHLLLGELDRDPSLLLATLAAAGSEHLDTMVAILDRAGQHDPDTATTMIQAIVETEPASWPTLLMVAATQGGGPALTALEHLATRPNTRIPLAELSAALPFSTFALFDLALAVDQQRLTQARSAGAPIATVADLLVLVAFRASHAADPTATLGYLNDAIERYRELADPAYLPHLAAALINLGAALSRLGEHDRALTATREAVDIHRRLSDTDPSAHRPNLAMSLTNVGAMLSRLGSADEALSANREAVEHYRELTTADPDAHLPEFAMSLNNLGTTLWGMGRHREALDPIRDAVDIRGRLVDANPSAYLADLAMSLTNLGGMLSFLGQGDEALTASWQAVEHYRELATANPTVHLPDLAGSLNNLGTTLWTLGHHEQALAPAQEAVDIRRRLSGTNPTAHLPDFARALHNLSSIASDLGQAERARDAIEEAVMLRRQLADANPAVHLHDLAMSLNNLGSMLADLGHPEEALRIGAEAVEHYRQLAASDPAAYLQGLATSLTNHATRLADLGDHERALRAASEAVRHHRALADADPTAHLPNLASALGNLGVRLSDLGDHEQARACALAAVDIQRGLAAANPTAHLPGFALALSNLGANLAGMGDHVGALAAVQQSLDIRRELAATNPTVHLPGLAAALNNLSATLWHRGRHEEAVDAAMEAVLIRRRLARVNPAVYLPRLAQAVHNLGTTLPALGQFERARDLTQEAVDIRRGLAESNRSAYLPDLAMSLSNLGATLPSLDKHDEALDAGREAVDLYRELAAANPTAYLPMLAAGLNNVGVMLHDLGKHGQARPFIEEAVDIRRRLAGTNPSAHLPDLAMSLKNFGATLSRLGEHERALDLSREAVDHYRELAAANPVVHLSRLSGALKSLATQLTETAQANDIPGVWNSAVEAMPFRAAQAELRVALSEWLVGQGQPDRAAIELRKAATVAGEIPSVDDAVSPESIVLLGRARRSVRAAVDESEPGARDLPSWATAPLVDSHVELITKATIEAEDWQMLRAVIDDHRDLFGVPDFMATVAVLLELHPQNTELAWLAQLLGEISANGIDEFLALRQKEHDRETLIDEWLGADGWAESAAFFRSHRTALLAAEVRNTLAGTDDDTARQHLAILELSAALPDNDIFDIVTNPGAAEQAAFTAIENGELDRLATIVDAAPTLANRPTTGALIAAVLLITRNQTAPAEAMAQHLADHGTTILRRAHTVRLRSLHEHRPDLSALLPLMKIIDPNTEPS